MEKFNYHKARCIDIVNLQRESNTDKGIYGNRDANISREIMKPSLNTTVMEFITLIHTRELIYIDNVGTVIMGGGVEEKLVVDIQSVGDIQRYTNIKEYRGKLTVATRY